MTVRKFKTNLNCGSCVAAVTPFLNGEQAIRRWSVDTADPRKLLTVEGESVSPDAVERLVANAGFRVLGEVKELASMPAAAIEKKSFLATYHPLLLVLGYLVGLVALAEVQAGSFEPMRAMGRFMGGFFIAFSFFKLLDLRGFVTSFQSYDIAANRWPVFGYAYPFVELSLGIAYLSGFQPVLTNLATLAIMALGLVGVTKALLEKRKIRCACLGAVFNLPMSSVTFLEDAIMAGMAVAMLLSGRLS